MFCFGRNFSWTVVLFVLAVCFVSLSGGPMHASEIPEKTMYEKALGAFEDAARYSVMDAGRATLSAAKATHYLEMAGNKGDERAMLCLGMLYEEAPGLSSKMTALRWYSKYLAKVGNDAEVEATVERLKKISGELAAISAGG